MKYNSLNVDEKYSRILEPNLFFDTPFVPGVTYTDKYQEGPAGQIYVHKLSTSAVEPGTPGRDFTDEATADELIPIAINNNYQKSKKIYGVQAAAVAFPVANEQLSLATMEVREGRQQSANACLVTEGTTSAEKTAITSAKNAIIAERTAISKAKGKADVILCAPDFFGQLLEEIGKEYTPVVNDRVAATGAIGTWFGFTIIEDNGLSATNAKYINTAGTTKTAAFAGVDFVMYNHEALSIIDNLEGMRIVDSENFVGSKAQVEVNTGFKVTNPALVRVRTHTVSA